MSNYTAKLIKDINDCQADYLTYSELIGDESATKANEFIVMVNSMSAHTGVNEYTNYLHELREANKTRDKQ